MRNSSAQPGVAFLNPRGRIGGPEFLPESKSWPRRLTVCSLPRELAAPQCRFHACPRYPRHESRRRLRQTLSSGPVGGRWRARSSCFLCLQSGKKICRISVACARPVPARRRDRMGRRVEAFKTTTRVSAGGRPAPPEALLTHLDRGAPSKGGGPAGEQALRPPRNRRPCNERLVRSSPPQ